jgi:hypothetical protein
MYAMKDLDHNNTCYSGHVTCTHIEFQDIHLYYMLLGLSIPKAKRNGVTFLSFVPNVTSIDTPLSCP